MVRSDTIESAKTIDSIWVNVSPPSSPTTEKNGFDEMLARGKEKDGKRVSRSVSGGSEITYCSTEVE